MSQSQGGSDTRQHIDSNSINISSTGAQNGDDETKQPLQPSGTPTDGEGIASQGNAMSTEANGIIAGNVYGGTDIGLNGGGILSDALSQQREPSPGPHLEEMETYIEEGGYIRANGTSHDAGAGSEEDGLSTLGSSQDSNDGDQDVSSDGYEGDLRRVKVRNVLCVSLNKRTALYLSPAVFGFSILARGIMELGIRCLSCAQGVFNCAPSSGTFLRFTLAQTCRHKHVHTFKQTLFLPSFFFIAHQTDETDKRTHKGLQTGWNTMDGQGHCVLFRRIR